MNVIKQAVNRRTYQGGMSLIEILVVIAIIGILAGMLFPALQAAQKKAKIAQARKEMSDIKLAIENFKSQYSIWPLNGAARGAGAPDFTFGTYGFSGFAVNESALNPGLGYQTNNAAVMYILLAEANLEHNPNHANNPQKKVFLTAKIQSVNDVPGVGANFVYLDPWRNPYVITIDANYDETTQDAFYCRNSITQPLSGGANGLNNLVSKSGLATNDFVFRGGVMVWSMGPDGKADFNLKADDGVNKDNIIGWQ
jgi:prepilin-type N-terminal cleavage/methylation domain-containing protein